MSPPAQPAVSPPAQPAVSSPVRAATYRDVLRLDGAVRAFVPAALARLSYGTLPLALLLTVQTASGSFATAGLVLAVFAVTTVALPLKSRMVDRHGRRRVLGGLGIGYPLALLALAGAARTTPAPVVLIALTMVAGLLAPPIGPSIRAVWVALCRAPDSLRRAYSLDTVTEEVLFTLGPTLVGVLLTVTTPVGAIGLSAGLAAAGTLGLATAPGPAGRTVPPPRLRRPSRLRRPGPPPPGLGGLLGMLAGFGLATTMLEVGVAARAEAVGATAQAGYLLAMLPAGSAVGGLAWGRRPPGGTFTRQIAALLAVFAVGCTVAALVPGLIGLGADLFVTGLVVAPVFITTYLAVERRAPADRGAEASSWVNTAHNLGSAFGSASAGLVIDTHGPRVALLVAAGPVALGPAVVAGATRVRNRVTGATRVRNR